MNKLLDFYRYLRNFLTISISGGFPERFLNLCSNEKIYLWNTSFTDGKVTANVYCKDFFKIKKIRSKSGVKIKIEEKHGLHFLLRKNLKRKALIAGLCVTLIFLVTMNQFIWNIEVQGSNNISKEEVLSVCDNLGLHYGTFVPLFDESKAGREAVNLFDGRILWMAINIKGSKATVEVRDYENKNNNTEDSTLCNIVADFDGVILSAEAFSGVLSTVCGSAVKKGDLLISGISENSDGSVNFHSADGRLTALHNSQLIQSYKDKYQSVKIVEESRYTVLDVFSISIPLSYKSFVSDDDKLSYQKYLLFDGKTLPFGFNKNSVIEKTAKEADATEIIFSIDEFTKAEYEKFKNSLIVNSEYSFSKEKDGYNIIADYDSIDFIGKKSAILQEN